VTELKGRVTHVCVSETKGTPKRPAEAAVMLEGLGIEGDGHAGFGHRQVSLLASEDVEPIRAVVRDLEPGDFGENLLVEGLPLGEIGVGTRLAVGDGELEVTQVGKCCHTPCSISQRVGRCAMPEAGLFARVLQGGRLRPGDRIRVIEHVPRETVQAAVVTVSDRAARGEAADTAGPAVAERLTKDLATRVSARALVPDEAQALRERLEELVEQRVEVVFTVGGTGMGPRDHTPEVTRSLIDREVPGMAEAMRAASLAVTPHAMLSRAVVGLCGRTLIVNLPGSEKAALENLDAILPALPHAVDEIRGRSRHPEADARRRSR
jgi:molybdenum cofactor synthesis domain-containing protein